MYHEIGMKMGCTMAGGRTGGMAGEVLAIMGVASWTICTRGVAPGAAARFCSKVGMTVFCRTSCSSNKGLLASGFFVVFAQCMVRLHHRPGMRTP